MWVEWNVRDHLNTPTVPTHKKKKKKFKSTFSQKFQVYFIINCLINYCLYVTNKNQ